jgi:hypothetical protein
VRRRAQARDVHVGGIEPRGDQLIAHRGPQIEHQPAGPRVQRSKPALEHAIVEPLAREDRRQLGPDLVAARADARADGRDEARGMRVEPAEQRRHGVMGNARRHPPPSGMRRRDGARRGIGEEERHAVRTLDRDGRGGIVADEDVRLQPRAVRARGRLLPAAHVDDARSVDLTEPHEAPGVERLGHPRPLALV